MSKKEVEEKEQETKEKNPLTNRPEFRKKRTGSKRPEHRIRK